MEMQQRVATVNQTNEFSLFATGFALFSMFFGAGNLIFPILLGQAVGANWWVAMIGLTLTAVIVPFLGLAGMVFFDADYKRFFGRLGKVPGFLLILLLQLILGPFGVIPRLVTLMHAIIKPYLFDVSLPVFSVFCAGVIFLCCFKRQNLIRILGVVLTPILLLSLALLFLFGFLDRPVLADAPMEATDSFLHGLFVGYNTMDLIAAFLFATVVLPHFQEEVALERPIDKKKALFKKIFATSLIAAALLFFTYIGLSFIAAYHAHTVTYSSSEELLGAIAYKLLGATGSFFAGTAILTACLTTAITLTLIFADYLQKDLCREKISSMTALIATLFIASCFSNLGFANIAAILGPILQICYPALIVLTVFNILHYTVGLQTIKTPVFLTFLLGAFLYFFGIT